MAQVRNDAVEWLRVMSAAGIVWYHCSGPGSGWGWTGLVVFVTLTMMFEAGPNFERSVPLSRLAQRLLVPWASWWALYAAFRILKGAPVLDLTHGFTLGVVAGPSIHLWYLPYMFSLLVLFSAIRRHVGSVPIGCCASCLAMIGILTEPLWTRAALNVGSPVWEWSTAAIPALIGLWIGSCHRSPKMMLWGAPLALVSIWSMTGANWFLTLRILLGAGLVVGAFSLGRFTPLQLPRAALLANAMFGVYLAHPLGLALFDGIVRQHFAVGVILVFVTTTAGVLATQHVTPSVASIVLGTPKTPRWAPLRGRASA